MEQIGLQNLLQELLEVRQQIQLLEEKKVKLESFIAPLAREQVLKNRQNLGQKSTNVLYNQNGYQLIYQERLDKKKINGHQDIQSVDFDIEEAKRGALMVNKTLIENLQKALDEVTITAECKQYMAEREAIVERIKSECMSTIIVMKGES